MRGSNTSSCCGRSCHVTTVTVAVDDVIEVVVVVVVVVVAVVDAVVDIATTAATVDFAAAVVLALCKQQHKHDDTGRPNQSASAVESGLSAGVLGLGLDFFRTNINIK